MSKNNQLQFLPFHTINEFMRTDFRLNVIRTTLAGLSQLPDPFQTRINQLTRKLVKVPGFRNSEKAPMMIKMIPISKSFEKDPAMVSAILSAWSEIHATLRLQVYDLLKKRAWTIFPSDLKNFENFPIPESASDWGILPPEVDRTKMPGFVIYWPKGETFEIIYQDFSARYPEANASIDEVSLMAVWLTLRLPYHITENEVEKLEISDLEQNKEN